MLVVVLAALPVVDGVPLSFPATLLWKFRIAAIGVQAVIWTTLGALFGVLAERTERTGSHTLRVTGETSAVKQAF